MAETVKAIRQPLVCNPTSSFTLKRDAHKQCVVGPDRRRGRGTRAADD